MIKINKTPNVVVIGGGTGVPVVLNGLKKYNVNLTAIVAVTDTGGHSGFLREELGILPPGDIRNCLIALSDADPTLKEVLSYRFSNDPLAGTNIGNLFLSALTQIHGSFQTALEEASRILKVKGKVFPSTWENVHICARLSDGTIVETEKEVDKENKPPIEEVFLKPSNVKASKEAIDAIKRANIIVIGPASLYTSILPNLLLKDLAKSIKKSKAKKIFVSNIMTQPGQTDNYTVSRHIEILEKYVGGKFLSHGILNSKIPNKEILEYYKKNKAFLTEDDSNKLKKIFVIKADLVEEKIESKWSELASIRHNPDKLGTLLIKLIQGE